ncbi:MAG: hypothetical protein U9O97_04775 [Elusimicrobiota bacterium]|nr:hypothetical protein [Elusimicrobiota bacterium]
MKRRRNKVLPRAPQSKAKGLRSRGESVGNVKLLSGGLVLFAAAFFVLRLANPAGDNFAAHAAPFMFIFSWVMILTGILWGGSKEGAAKNEL